MRRRKDEGRKEGGKGGGRDERETGRRIKDLLSAEIVPLI